MNRLDFIRGGAALGAVAAAGCVTGKKEPCRGCEDLAKTKGRGKCPFRLGAAGYTFHKFSLDETLAMLKTWNVGELCAKSFHYPMKASAAELKETFNFARVPCAFSFDGCSVKLSCDRRSLKFDVSVADDTPFNERSGWWSWNGDSLQVGLARLHLKKRTQNDIADAFAQARSEHTVAKTPEGDQICRTISWDLTRFPCDNDRAGLVAPSQAPRKVVYDGGRWRYTFSLPWTFLNMDAPQVGETFRMALQYNDRTKGDPGIRQVECFDMKLAAPQRFGWFVIGQ